MKIRYTKKRLRSNLIVGLIWLSLSIVLWVLNNTVRWPDFLYVGMALLYLGQYLYERQNHYLTITKDEIKVNRPFGKQINITEINRIKKIAGDYKIIATGKEMNINTQIIDQYCLKILNEFLAKLSLPPDKTPFANNVNNAALASY